LRLFAVQEQFLKLLILLQLGGVGFIIVDIAALNYDEHGTVHG